MQITVGKLQEMTQEEINELVKKMDKIRFTGLLSQIKDLGEKGIETKLLAAQEANKVKVDGSKANMQDIYDAFGFEFRMGGPYGNR